jgi:hypothetical protein
MKAMYQFLTDQGITKDSLAKVIESKVKDAVSEKIGNLINSKHFDQLIVAAVADFLRSTKEVFDRHGGYSVVNHIRDLVRKELQETILKEYQVTVTKVNP